MLLDYMLMVKLTIQIVGYNGAEHLGRACEALKKIPKEEAVIRYIDNGSTDESVEVVRRGLLEADIIERGVNTGYAGGHNFGFSLCTTAFVLVHDQDVVIEWEGIKKLLEAFEDEKVGAVQGKIYRSAPSLRRSRLLPTPPKWSRRTFDSAGIVQTLSLNGVDRGANEEDRGQFDEPAEILAAQGACALYRMGALMNVANTHGSFTSQESAAAYTGEVFPPRLEILDNDFFAYKEDVDLGWRLKNAGWKTIYRPVVMGTHARTLGKRGVGGWGLSPAGIYSRLKSSRTRLSLRNYCWMIAKNASVGQAVLHSPFIFGRLCIFILFTLIYWPLFPAWGEMATGIPKMLAKRS